MAKEETSQQKARLRVALPTGETYKHKITGSESRIGSGANSDIPIVDPDVSTNHATLALNGDGYVIVDEGAPGGTFVNGQRIAERRKLSHGDVIRVGKSEITFKIKRGKDLKAESPYASSSIPVDARPGTDNAGSEEKKKRHKHKKDKHKDRTAEQAVYAAGAERSEMSSSYEDQIKKDKHKKDKQKEKSGQQAVFSARAQVSPLFAPVVIAPLSIAPLSDEGTGERAGYAQQAPNGWLSRLPGEARGAMIATIVFVLLTVIASILLPVQKNDQPGVTNPLTGVQSSKKLANLSDIKKINGGQYEASGAVDVPGLNGILFVDDSRPDAVFFLPVNGQGEQDGEVKAIQLGVSVKNPEGISRFGSRFMVIGSLSTIESNDKGGGAAFDFDPVTQTVSNAVALTGLRKFLSDNVPELKVWANKASAEGGLNIEGIAVDPNPEHTRVLLGLRGPVLNGKALIVPIRILDRKAPLSLENLAVDEQKTIHLNLNGQAIRDIQYDDRLKSFLIISGAPETEKKSDFTLWVWNGDGNQSLEESRPKEQGLLGSKMKPEGITPLKISNQEFVFIVGDASSYAKIDYTSP